MHGLKLVGGKLVGRELVVAEVGDVVGGDALVHEGSKLLGGSPAGVAVVHEERKDRREPLGPGLCL